MEILKTDVESHTRLSKLAKIPLQFRKSSFAGFLAEYREPREAARLPEIDASAVSDQL